MMPPKDNEKKKDARRSTKKYKNLVSKSEGKAKKKWSTGKVQHICHKLVLLDKATYDELCKDIPQL